LSIGKLTPKSLYNSIGLTNPKIFRKIRKNFFIFFYRGGIGLCFRGHRKDFVNFLKDLRGEKFLIHTLQKLPPFSAPYKHSFH